MMFNQNFNKRLGVVTVATLGLFVSVVSAQDVGNRANAHNESRQSSQQSVLGGIPEWVLNVPKSDYAIYQSGTASSNNLSMSRSKARNMAYGQICVTAGGNVTQKNEMFISDIGDNSVEISEMAIRTACSATDITGAEIVEEVVVMENSKYRTFVLVGLPLGDSNILLEGKRQYQLNKKALDRSDRVFEEMEGDS